jgi:hypothetical protein
MLYSTRQGLDDILDLSKGEDPSSPGEVVAIGAVWSVVIKGGELGDHPRRPRIVGSHNGLTDGQSALQESAGRRRGLPTRCGPG